MATSRRCPERIQWSRKHKVKPTTEMRSSPPVTSGDQPPTTEQAADAEDMDEDVATPVAGESIPTQTPSVALRMEGRRPGSSWSDSTSNSDFDLEPSTPTPRGKEQTPMSVDHDSAAA